MYDQMLVATLYDERVAHLRPLPRWRDEGRGILAWRIGMATDTCWHAVTHALDVLAQGMRRRATVPSLHTRVTVH
jgi:hypothetical protein